MSETFLENPCNLFVPKAISMESNTGKEIKPPPLQWNLQNLHTNQLKIE